MICSICLSAFGSFFIIVHVNFLQGEELWVVICVKDVRYELLMYELILVNELIIEHGRI